MDTRTGPDGETVYIERAEATRGAKGPFFVVYDSENRETRWGFFCGNCETLDNAVDAMGRIHCNRCSNRTKAEEWDSAHE
jgi:hypothetical protein